MRSIGLVRALSVLGCFVVAQLLSGCLHLHSPALQQAADAAKTEFNTMVVAAPSSANLAAFFSDSAVTLAVVRDIHRLGREAQLAILLDQPWRGLLQQTDAELRDSRSQLNTATAAKGAAEARLKDELVKLGAAKKGVATHVEALTEASRTAARYVATQTLIAEALKAAADRTRPGSFGALREALNRSVTYETHAVTTAGIIESKAKKETIAQLLDLDVTVIPTGAPKSVKDVEDLVGALGKIDRLPASVKNFTFRNPGIATTILGLGFDVARAAEREAAGAVRTSKQEIDLREAQQAFLARHIRRLEEDLDEQSGVGLAAAATFETDHSRPVRATLAALIDAYQRSASPSNRGRLHLAHLALATNFKLRFVDARERAILEDRLTALLPQQALTNDVARLGLREAVIGRGLDGLVAFHAGGITPEDFSRIIGIAQTIGIFIIAGGQ
jgi:hypothetical protein